MKNRITWPLIIAGYSLLAGIASLGFLPSLFQFLIVSSFVVVVPGLSYIRLLRPLEPLPMWIIATSLSIVLSILVTIVMLLTHAWYPMRGLYFLVVISILGAVLQFVLSDNSNK